MTARARVPALVAVFLAIGPLALTAQSLLQRTPNLSGGWDGTPGTLYFNFLHRFTVTPAPQRQVTNYPTFLLGAGLPGNALIAFNYSTRSGLVPNYPNEWEFLGRVTPWLQITGSPVDVSLQAGYNLAAESVDGELGVSRQIGPLRLLGAARAMTHAYGQDSIRVALAGGASLQFLRWFALAGDYAQLIQASDTEKAAWGAALQIAIPYTPHTLSLQVTNTNSLTVEGSSRGEETRRYGFEFTIPLHLNRFFGGPQVATRSSGPQEEPTGTGPVVRARMRNAAFEPAELRIQAGTTVVWSNDDQMMHTVKAADASWESPEIPPGGTYRRAFTTPGRFEVTCGPHPFMKVVVEVR